MLLAMIPQVSIIILNYCQAGLVKQLLLLLQKMTLSFSTEIIVVDNNSSYKSVKDLQEKFAGVNFIYSSHNKGYAAGNNLGIKQARGEYILILNPDLAPTTQSLEELYKFLLQNPQTGMVGPKLVNADGSYQLTCGNFPDWHMPMYRRTWLGKTRKGQQWLDNYLMRQWNHGQAKSVPWLFGAALMVRRQALDQVGLLDERYFLYVEDLDWCRRFWEKGWQVWYVPSSQIIHFHQRESLEGGGLGDLTNAYTRIHIISWFKYLWKFRGRKMPTII